MKVPISRALIEQGLAQDAREAAALIMSGRVYINRQRAAAGQLVATDAPLHVRGFEERYVAKGGYKLEGALAEFSIDVSGRVCLDAGASTGGFTDCLLKHGAHTVYAVDVGYGQLMGSLRQDVRVINMERVNISDERLLSLSPTPSIGTCDLSYLSLRQGVPHFRDILHSRGDLICLVKPLFETRDMQARRTGILQDAQYAPLLQALVDDINQLQGCRVMQLINSPITGNAATLEFFMHVALGKGRPAPDISQQIAVSVEKALALPAYHKGDVPKGGA
ncbi:MAG: TlyA family RNA methyltransferase [Clostridiales bacterium]|nr:TlyA family RNA methyltransferase [Clostridiales bacterium]